MRARTILTVAGVCGVLLAGCSQSDHMIAAGSSNAASAAASTTAPQSPEEDGEQLQTLGPLADITEDDRSAAHDRAVEFLRAYANTGVGPTAWWAGIQPLLSPSAAEDYSYVDPAEVPAMEVQDDQVEDLPGASGSLVQVEVSTSIGDYVVTLTRTGATDPWLVGRADPPAEVP